MSSFQRFRLIFLFAFIFFATSFANSFESKQWHIVEHKVKKGQTLRSVARLYFGPKQGVYCLIDQLELEDPNRLRPGQKLTFLAPAKKMKLKKYLNQNVRCSPDRVVAENVETLRVKFKENLSKERQPAESNDILVSSSELKELGPSVRRTWSGELTLGPGATYSVIRQANQSTVVDFTSAEFGSVNLQARWWRNENWNYSFGLESLPSVIPGEQVGAEQKSLNFQSMTMSALYFPNQSELFVQTPSLKTYMNMGVQHMMIPLLDPLSSGLIETDQASLQYIKFGAGLIYKLNESWLFESQLNLNHPVAFQKFTKINNRGILDGSIRLEKSLSENWKLGAIWHGQYFHADAAYESSSRSVDADFEFLFSSLETTIGRSF